MATIRSSPSADVSSSLILGQDIISQDPLTHGAMFVPIILGSDKTTVSVATGQNEYYPLYLSIGNVQNHMRRAHKNALVVIGFLPIPKGKISILSSPCSHRDFRQVPEKTPTQKSFVLFKRTLTHDAIANILIPLKPFMTTQTSFGVPINTFVAPYMVSVLIYLITRSKLR
jgi:hypothetical protein